MNRPAVEVADLHVAYGAPDRNRIRAVRGVDLRVHPGRCLALVGESGCGKSSVARAILRLAPADSGRVALSPPGGESLDFLRLRGRQLRQARRHIQIVFQDPMSSLDPRRTLARSIGEPLENFPAAAPAGIRARVAELMDAVGLDPSLAHAFPHQVSGGQRQRAVLARALAPRPSVLVLDEAVSALDASLRAQVLNLLLDLKTSERMAMIFITHDMSAVRALADDLAVMFLGRIVEEGPAADVLGAPRHPYTQALLDAIPVPDPGRERLRPRRVVSGEPPSPLRLPRGCSFQARCPVAEDDCRRRDPVLSGETHRAACPVAMGGAGAGPA